ncbi:MAG: alkaline phosphatase family protein [Planctomycetes bacterium]|nr:alkaline phosphatase family protein [Planctomycetota bacterium]
MDRRAAAWTAAVAFVLALGALGLLERLLATADRPPGFDLTAQAAPAPDRPPGHLLVVLVDGLRVDDAERLPAWRALAPSSAVATIALPTPTFSRPFYHLLLTGVPPDASGVRSNRFDGRARHDAVTDRVRAAGGSAAFVAEGIDWLRRMHGRPGDGGTDADDALGAPLDEAVRRWRAAPAPSLLLVHVIAVDEASHAHGVGSAAQRAALERADATLARLARAAEGAPVVVLSDHGHLDAGGHGGHEPEVARAPLLARALGLPPGRLAEEVDATRLAATLAAWLGVPPPLTAVGAPVEALAPRGATFEVERHRRLAAAVEAGRRAERERLARRRTWLVPLALVALTLAWRATGSTPALLPAALLWPALVVGLHLLLGRPLTHSALDTTAHHAPRVAALGVLAALATGALAAARVGPRRAALLVGWSAATSALLAGAWVGLALGPWPLGPRERYLPLLLAGAAAAALVAVAITLAAGAWRERAIAAASAAP